MGMFDVLKKDYKPKPKEKMQAEGKQREIQLGYVTGTSHDYSRSSLIQNRTAGIAATRHSGSVRAANQK